MKRLLLATCTLAVASAFAPAQTPLPGAFTYQGELRSASALASGPYDIRFRLFDAASGGAQVGATLCVNNVAVVDGRFTVSLDFGAQFAGEERYLDIGVRADTGLGCGNATGYATLTPRQSLAAAPNSLFALNASAAVTATTAATATNSTQLNGQGPSFYRNASNLNAGTVADARLSSNVSLLSAAQTFTGAKAFSGGLTTTDFTLPAGAGAGKVLTSDALGAASWQNPGLMLPYAAAAPSSGALFQIDNTSAAPGNYGIYATTMGTSSWAVIGKALAATGNPVGVQGEATSPNGAGMHAASLATTGPGVGLLADCHSTGGAAVRTLNYATNAAAWLATSNTGVYAESGSATGAYGVYAYSDSLYGRAVVGYAAGAADWGIFGQTASTAGRAVGGTATATTGSNYGGFFQNVSTSGGGVYGEANAGSGFTNGGRFECSSTSGKGVYGEARANSGTTYGVLGLAASPGGWSVYAQGDLGASGSKSFRIDHPDDPENKYLLHYCSESPEVINFYSGKTTLDDRGEAVVELPGYFAKINRDPRYMLTAVGAAMPMLHVSEEIDEGALAAGAAAEPGEVAPVCTFRVASGVPGGRISWRVEAVRNDRWIQRRGAPVEVEKQDLERGTYQHPELYGRPRERATGYDARAPLAPGAIADSPD